MAAGILMLGAQESIGGLRPDRLRFVYLEIFAPTLALAVGWFWLTRRWTTGRRWSIPIECVFVLLASTIVAMDIGLWLADPSRSWAESHRGYGKVGPLGGYLLIAMFSLMVFGWVAFLIGAALSYFAIEIPPKAQTFRATNVGREPNL